MDAAFSNHIVICGWNSRGKSLIRLLQVISTRLLLIVHNDMSTVTKDLKQRERVCFLVGDAAVPEVLRAAEVAHAHSVIVLSDEALGLASDARSVQIALAVERIRSSVYSVVEVRDLRNKAHFSRTKVDDIVSEQNVAICLISQGVRHLHAQDPAVSPDGSSVSLERDLIKTYHQLLNPFQSRSQLFRLEFPWSETSDYTFSGILREGLLLGICPVSLVGYLRHEHRSRFAAKAGWVSWKTHCMSNPSPKKRIRELWDGWPGNEYTVGVLYLGPAGSSPREHAVKLLESLRARADVPRKVNE